MVFGRSLSEILIVAVTFLMAITVHELAHGYVAYKLGDSTAKNEGRLTLNPIAHLDPIGALLMLVVGFGWAKPVPVNPYYFTIDRQKGMMLVSVAGPLANLALAFLLTVILGLTGMLFGSVIWVTILLQAIFVNVMLCILNLLPIPPLDGSKILAGFLPRETAYRFLSVLDQYGMLLLLLLSITNVLSMVISPIIQVVYNGLLSFTPFL